MHNPNYFKTTFNIDNNFSVYLIQCQLYMIFEDLYEDYWTIEASAKINLRLLPSYFFSRLLPCSFQMQSQRQDRRPNYVQLDHHPTSMYNKFNKALSMCNMMSHPLLFPFPLNSMSLCQLLKEKVGDPSRCNNPCQFQKLHIPLLQSTSQH